MKKLAALASMAVLLCASASFAKKAMDEQEMDLVTAAGQPTVVDVTVKQDGPDLVTSETTADSTLDVQVDPGGTVGSGQVDVDATALELNVSLGSLDVVLADGTQVGLEDGALLLDVANANIDSQNNVTGPVLATASAAATSTIDAGDVNVMAGATDLSTATLVVQTDSQSTLRAITLNNVVGENQLATAVNIASAAFNASGSQSNEINQSWGASFDWSFAPGGAAEGGRGGDIVGDKLIVNNPCVLNAGDCGVGSGGDAASFDNKPLTISADQIVKVDVESQGNATVHANMTDLSTSTVTIESMAQIDLAALTVNNIAGKNQVASGLNVTSAGATVIGGGAGEALVVFGNPVVGGQTSFSTAQSNTINQYRGTPCTACSGSH